MRQDPNLHYLDNAATTLVSKAAAAAVATALREDWANPSSLYPPALDSAASLARSRAAVARTLGCQPSELFFTASGSEGNNIALLAAAQARASWGKRIVVSGFEHPSVQLPLRRLAGQGFEVVEILPERDGTLRVEKLAEAVTKATSLVACMMVNNETGARVDVERLAALVKTKNPRTAVHVDAVQAWLRLPIDLGRLSGIDSLAVAGHKIHAPKGVGALCLRRGYGQSLAPFVPYLGGGQERGLRPGTENIAFAAALAAAAKEGEKTFAARNARAQELNARLRQGLAALSFITLNSPDTAVAEVLNFSENCIRSNTMLNFLAGRGIYVSSGSACSRGEASHTLTAMGCDPLTIDTALRVSFCGDNTPEDVDALLEALEDGLKGLAHIKRKGEGKR